MEYIYESPHKGKTIYEELEIYLKHIKVSDVEVVMNEYRSIA